MSDDTAGRPLSFIDHHRQRYAGKVPIAEAGEFIVGSCLEDGSLDRDGEFKVTLHELGDVRDRRPLKPRLEAFGDGVGALRRAIEAGLLETLGPTASREECRAAAVGDRDGRRLRRAAPGGRGLRAGPWRRAR